MRDYLPILNGAIITDCIVILRLSLGQIKSNSLRSWYHKYGISGVLTDVLSIAIGVLITRFIYPMIFGKYSLIYFLGLAVIVQLVHDLTFAYFFNRVPRGRSQILDTFKDYAKEMGSVILLADAAMVVTTILLGTLFSQMNQNSNMVLFIVLLYMVPYFLYSV